MEQRQFLQGGIDGRSCYFGIPVLPGLLRGKTPPDVNFIESPNTSKSLCGEKLCVVYFPGGE